MEGAAESQRGKSIKDNNEQKKKKSLGRSEGVGNKGGGSDRSRDVTVCENIKCLTESQWHIQQLQLYH